MPTYNDDFNRADAGNLGANWQRTTGNETTELRVVGNGVRGNAFGASLGARWIANAVGPDQRSRFTIPALPTSGNSSFDAATVRSTGADGTRAQYQFTANITSSGGTQWYLTRVLAGSGTDIASGNVGTPWAAGDTIECEAVEGDGFTTVRALRNGVQVATFNDSTGGRPATGQPGIERYMIGTVHWNLDDWQGGDVGGGGTTTLEGDVTTDEAVATGSLAPAPPSVLTGDITADEATASGQIGSGASVLGGDVTTAEAEPTGTLGLQFSTVVSLPFTRNPGNGGRLFNLPNIAVAVLTDDANLARLNGSTTLLMAGDGRVTFANGVPLPPGSSVILVTREPGANGALGVDRRTTT